MHPLARWIARGDPIDRIRETIIIPARSDEAFKFAAMQICAAIAADHDVHEFVRRSLQAFWAIWYDKRHFVTFFDRERRRSLQVIVRKRKTMRRPNSCDWKSPGCGAEQLYPAGGGSKRDDGLSEQEHHAPVLPDESKRVLACRHKPLIAHAPATVHGVVFRIFHVGARDGVISRL